MNEQETISRLQDQMDLLKEQLDTAQIKLAEEAALRKQVEEAHLSSENIFKTLVENSHDVMYSIRVDGTFTYISPQIKEFGYTQEEVIGQHVMNFIAPEHRDASISKFRDLVKTAGTTPVRLKWLEKNGNHRWVEVVAKNVNDESGQPVERIGVMRDIHYQREKEEEYKSLTLLLDTLDAECFIKDMQGVYKYVNRAYEEQFDVSREDVIGRDDVFVFGAEDAAMLKENDQRIMDSKIPEVVEEAAYLQGNKYVVYLTHKTPILDQNGDVSGICGVGVDITHQKEIENRLRQSEEKYRNLVEQISEVIYAVNLEGAVTYISPAVEAFLGYSPDEVTGKRITDFVVPEEYPRINDNFRRLSTGAMPGPNEYLALTKSGETRWMRTSSHPVIEEGHVVGIQGAIADITDHKLAEMQLSQAAANAERERLARELHDSVTQTLYSVAAIAEALPRIWERSQEQARAGLGDLETLTHAALAEMRTLLLELRPEALEKQNLTELLPQLTQGLMGRTHMPVNLSLDDDCRIPADVQIALYRITQEALNNIIKHARASQAKVDLACEAGLVKLIIKDDGVGFNPQGVTSHRLGLEIMRERAENIGAKFDIQSQPDQGTQICVTWQDEREG